MARYVDVENIKKLFDEEFKKTRKLIDKGEIHLDNLAEGFLEADRVLFKLPTADVVEVVRCKDCIYKHTAESTPITYCKALSSGIIRPVLIKDNDYCSYGKRKEVEEE